MKNLIKPYSLLLYLLVIIVFFFIGILYAGLVEAGKNQGLAGGAIVLGYGVMSAFFALIASLIAAYKLAGKVIININKILGVAMVGFIAYFTWNYYTNVLPEREEKKKDVPTQPKQTSPTVDVP